MLNVVFAAPSGERLDTPENKQAVEDAVAKLKSLRVQADRGQGRHRERQRSIRPEQVLGRQADRLCGGPVRPGHLRQGSRGRRRRPGRSARDGRAGRPHGRVQRRRRVPADRAGAAGAARPAGGADRPDRRLPHLRGGVDPDSARADSAGDRVRPALHPRRPDRHQHDHAVARVDDRTRCRDRLLPVHRHPFQTASARGAVPGRRRLRGRILRGPRRALRRPDRRDLRHRPGLLRPRLRHQARHRLGTRRPHDRGDRELAADRGAGKAGAQGRPVEGALPPSARRFGGGAREDSDRPLGPLRDRSCPGGLRGHPGAWTRRSRARRHSSVSVRPTRAPSPRSRRPAAPTTSWRRDSAPASTAPSRSSST